MDLALKTAENAGKAGEVPIGCVIVRGFDVIATAGNRVLIAARSYVLTGQIVHSGAVFVYDATTGELIRTVTIDHKLKTLH